MKQNNNTVQKDFTFLTISLFVLITLWIFFNAYHVRLTSTLSEMQQTSILPINPSFDKKTVENLKQRPRIQPDYENPLKNTASKAASFTSETDIAVPALSPEPTGEEIL